MNTFQSSQEMKCWSATVQLELAAEFLKKPDTYKWVWRPIRTKDLKRAEILLWVTMVRLETLGRVNGAKTGFWRRIRKVAETLGDGEKVCQYEHEFHCSLKKNIKRSRSQIGACLH